MLNFFFLNLLICISGSFDVSKFFDRIVMVDDEGSVNCADSGSFKQLIDRIRYKIFKKRRVSG